MHITPQELKASAVRLSVREGETEIARAFLYLINNNLHDKPYGLLEDVFVQEAFRSQGYGKKIVQAAIAEAKKRGCYKLIGTSRYEREKVHQFYQELGFNDYGKEFRMDL